MKHDEETQRARLIAKVLRDVLGGQPFTTIADGVDVLKFELARLRIDWTPDAITTAVGWVHPVQPFGQARRWTQGVVVPVIRRASGHDRKPSGQRACRA